MQNPNAEPQPQAPPAGRRLRPDELTAGRPNLAEITQLPRTPLVGVLENIRSLWNVGSMFRTADATRLEQLVLCGYTGHPPRAEIEKTALGATETVPWQFYSQGVDAVKWLKDSGYHVLALEHTTHSQTIEAAPLHSPVALVVGNEVQGVSDGVLALCDGAVEIPMRGVKESLNVAVAFGIAAYSLAARIRQP